MPNSKLRSGWESSVIRLTARSKGILGKSPLFTARNEPTPGRSLISESGRGADGQARLGVFRLRPARLGESGYVG